jgi:hypothetical protein
MLSKDTEAAIAELRSRRPNVSITIERSTDSEGGEEEYVIRVAAFEIVEGILHKGYASPTRVKYAKGEPIGNAHGMLVPLIRLAGQDLDISISKAH